MHFFGLCFRLSFFYVILSVLFYFHLCQYLFLFLFKKQQPKTKKFVQLSCNRKFSILQFVFPICNTQIQHTPYDQCLDLHKMSSSMHEVFNWGHVNESRPKRLSLFLGASEINIDDPPPPTKTPQKPTYSRSHGETFIHFYHNYTQQSHAIYVRMEIFCC